MTQLQVCHWLEKINITPSIETMYFLIRCKQIFVTYHKQSTDNTYSDAEGSIYKVLKYSLQETLDLVPITILIILFCSLNILTTTPVATRSKA